MIHGRLRPHEITTASRLQVIHVQAAEPVPPRGPTSRRPTAPRPAARPAVGPDGHDEPATLRGRLEARLAAGLRRRRAQPDGWYTYAA